jgi:hypothetical protein
MKRPFKNQRPVGPFFQRRQQRRREDKRRPAGGKKGGHQTRTGSSSISPSPSSNETQTEENTPIEIVKGATYIGLVKHDDDELNVFYEIDDFFAETESYEMKGDGIGRTDIGVDMDPTQANDYQLNVVIFQSVGENNATTSDIENAMMEEIADRMDIASVDVQRLTLMV